MSVQKDHEENSKLEQLEIDIETLELVVRRVLNEQHLSISKWDLNQVHGGAGTGTEIYRIQGEATNTVKKSRWSLILKILHPSLGATHETAWNYYKREAKAYQSDLLNNLQGEIKAPNCYAITEQKNGDCWIWLEDVREDLGKKWPIEYYRVVARQLGRFNGCYLEKDGLDQPWLSRNWVKHWVEYNSTSMDSLSNLTDHPYVKLWLPDDQLEKMLTLWDERENIFNALNELPQTLCHLDAFRRNMFARKASNDYETVLIDWAFVGISGLGTEILPLVRATISFSEAELSDFKRLSDTVFQGYMEGLKDVGWSGDPDMVRFGYAASNIRYSFLTNLIFNLIVKEEIRPKVAKIYGSSIEELLTYWGRCRKVYSQLDDEALRLLSNLK